MLLPALFMILLFTDQKAENSRIRKLNKQLNQANDRLQDYAFELERMTEARERNRQAREIHDILGHTLMGIIYWNKMEDIINRGGGQLKFRLWNATKDEGLGDTDVEICQDGRRYMVPAGSEIILNPGESLSLYPYYYHEFSVIGEPTLIGEVSMCNDDNTDNRFLDMPSRFPTIEEDEPPYRLLCNEYPAARD